MALYPTKVLLDKNRRPFIPFVTAESILFNNTDKSLAYMLYDRYTKEEVDNIIRNLGTIQVLRGRVNTYEDLQAIENPQAGDVYIVGTSNTNNSEYIYIGNDWEELGPMVDLSNLVTIDDLIARLGAYATITYVDNLIQSRPVVEYETSAAMTGEELHLAILNKTLEDGVVVTCTTDYLSYETGHTYLIKEGIRGEVPVADQLRELGFTVDEIESSLENKEIKYFYIANFENSNIDGISSACAYSKVPLDTSDSEFPSTGWKTFSVSRKSTSDPNFYYADGSIYQGNDNMVLDTMLLLDNSSNGGNWYSVQHSSELLATYTNDPEAEDFTYYSSGEDELILIATDITPIQEIDTSAFADATVTSNELAARPTFEQTNGLINNALGTAEAAVDAIIDGGA